MLELLSREARLDAAFFAGDVWAAGAPFECQRRGRPVPGRLAIAGLDNQGIASEICPQRTTISVLREEIGRRATSMLLDRLDGKDVGPKIVDVEFELIVRKST